MKEYIEYTLMRQKRKSISIKAIDNSIYVFADMYSKVEYIEKILFKNLQKILNKLKIYKTTFKSGDKVLVFGKEYDFYIKYTMEEKNIDFYNDKLIANVSFEEIIGETSVSLESFYKELLKGYLEESLKKYTNIIGLYPKKSV